MRSDPLSPDNGGVSGTAYWVNTTVQPAAPRSIQRPAPTSGFHLTPTLWVGHLAAY